jgi:hypothetical protein
MNYLVFILGLSIFSSVQGGEHQALKLAQAFVALLGEQYGKEPEMMSPQIAAAIDVLYASDYTVISNDNLLATSRDGFKENLKQAKCKAGLWRVTEVIYAPNASDTKVCNIAFRCWTQKTGVFDVNAEIQSSLDGARIEFLEEKVEKIYTVEQVS